MLKHTALYEWHKNNGARLAEFAGWEMPIQYADGAIAEHHLVRQSLGIFDVSHMAQISVTGDAATEWLERMVSAHVAAIPAGGSSYALLCREGGGVLDDLFIYRLADEWLVVANAANEEKDLRWLRHHLPGDESVTITNKSPDLAMFAVQGPNAIAVMDALTNGAAGATERFYSNRVQIKDVEVVLGRTGYTGEDGVELFVPNESADKVWTAVLAAADEQKVSAGPIGLAARDSLRFEPGFALYGHELSEDITPVEARLTWACAFATPFIGRDAIRAKKDAGPDRKLATIRLLEKGVPRQGCEVLADGEKVGEVVSGMYAPTVDAYCANAFLLPERAKSGTVVEVDIRGRLKRAEVVKRPLYTPAYR
jgi:glycine cleavage system T protein